MSEQRKVLKAAEAGEAYAQADYQKKLATTLILSDDTKFFLVTTLNATTRAGLTAVVDAGGASGVGFSNCSPEMIGPLLDHALQGPYRDEHFVDGVMEFMADFILKLGDDTIKKIIGILQAHIQARDNGEVVH